MLNSHHDHYYRKYLMKGFSSHHLLYAFLVYVALALPFYFSFGGSNFWLNPQTKLMTTSYNYTGYYAIEIHYVASNTSFRDQLSNIPGNAILPSSPNINIAVNDQLTESNVYLSARNYLGKEITSINLLLYYDVYLQDIDKVISTAFMTTIEGNIYLANSTALINFESTASPIPAYNIHHSRIYHTTKLNTPAYYPDLMAAFPSLQTLTNYLLIEPTAYKLRSRITQNIITGFAATRSAAFSLSKMTQIPIAYYPTILETLKFNFSRYLAFVIISYFIFRTLLLLWAKNGMIEVFQRTEIIEN